MRTIALVFLLLISLSTGLFAQNGTSARLRIFVEGQTIDFNYIRNKTPFVDFVNDAKACDVHIIVSRQDTGGGGSQFTLEYSAPTLPQIGTMKLTCITMSYDTQDLMREKLTKTLQTGLLPYVNEKGGAQTILIEAKDSTLTPKNQQSLTKDQDPWHQWVFNLDLNGGLSGEKQKKNNNEEMSFTASKVTDEWKFRLYYDYERWAGKITRSNGDITHTLRVEQYANIHVINSLGPHWSWGLFVNTWENSYENIDKAIHFQPALQYNFFPWKESDRRRFTFTYNVGPKFHQYTETTIFGKNCEWLWEQSMGLDYERTEKWGEVYSWLQTGHFLPNFENYYFQAGFNVYLRVAKGISLSFDMEAESIHNQVYLPAGEISDDDILLNNRRLPTSFQYNGSVGIRFQFGSIFNNVVNERL